jgi:hypothetical protein
MTSGASSATDSMGRAPLPAHRSCIRSTGPRTMPMSRSRSPSATASGPTTGGSATCRRRQMRAWMRSTRSLDTSANYSEGTVSIERTTSALVDHRLEGRAPHGRRWRLELPTRMRLMRVPTAEQLPGRRSPGRTTWQRDLGWGAGSPQNHLLLRACSQKVARFRAVKCETGLALHLQPRTAMTVKFRVRVARSWWSPASQIQRRHSWIELQGPSGEEDLPC